jgi:predicted RND superfamily exporter protein
MDSEVRDFHRRSSAELSKTIEEDFREGGSLTLTFEAAKEKSLFTTELLHQQLKALLEIKKRFKVTTFSLVDGIDEALKRTKGHSLLDENAYSTVAEGILAMSGGRTVRDLDKVSRHLLSPPGVIDFYQKFRIAAAVGAPFLLGASKLEFDVPFVKAARAYVQFDPGYSPKEQKQISVKIRDLLQTFTTPDLKIYSSSTGLVAYDNDQSTWQNVFLMVLLLGLAEGFLLWAIFQKTQPLAVLFFTLTASTLWTFGIAGLFGMKLSLVHLLVLPILLGTGDDNSIVFGTRLSEELRRGYDLPSAIRSTYAAIGNGFFLTTFTTLVAFLASALTGSAKVVVTFSLLVSLSMGVLLLLSVLLEGALRVELAKLPFWRKPARPDRPLPFINKFLKGLAPLGSRALNRRPRSILTVCLLLFAAGIGASFLIVTESDNRIYVRRNTPTASAYEANDKFFGFIDEVGYILIEGDVANPLVLGKMKLLEERMGRYPLIEEVLGKPYVESINDLIERKAIRLTPESDVRAIFDQILQSHETANYILNQSYQDMAGHLLRHRNGRIDGLLMKFFVKGKDPDQIRRLCETLDRDIQELNFHEIPGIRLRIGGGSVGQYLEEGYYFTNSIQAFFWSLLPNVLILAFIWKRFWHSLLAMVPLLLAVTLTLAMMPLFHVKLNVLNLTIGAIIVGLGVDYPIHVIERFEEERRGGAVSRLTAAQAVLSSMGPSIFAGCLTTMIGFASFSVLALPVAESFGLLTAAALFFVYLATTFLLPVLLVGRRNGDIDEIRVKK